MTNPLLVALVVGLLCRSAALAADPATTCKTNKMIAAATYDFCLLRTTARAMRTGVTPDLAKCDAKFNEKFAKAESKGGSGCPTTGDTAAIRGQVQNDVAAIVAALSAPAPSSTTSTTTTTSVTSTTGTTAIACGTYPGCGGACPAGMSCWGTILPGPTTTCSCLPETATPCTSTGGGLSAPVCGGACPAGEVCATIDISASIIFSCGCIPAGESPCLSFSGPTPCGSDGCPTGTSCGADPLQLLGCKCQ